MKLSFFIIILAGFLPMGAFAAEDSAFAEKARSRQYVGGPDESDLKVQAKVLKLQKSKNETNTEEDEGF